MEYSMKPGDKVLCISDHFASRVRKSFDKLPIAGHVYTIAFFPKDVNSFDGTKPVSNAGVFTLREIPKAGFKMTRFRKIEPEIIHHRRIENVR